MATRKTIKTTGLDELQANSDNMAKKVDNLVTGKSTTTASKPASKPFKKPNSDYYRLDLIVRELESGKMTEAIKTDYKEYLNTMAAVEGVSITKYIHSLLDDDMKKRSKEYEAVKKVINANKR